MAHHLSAENMKNPGSWQISSRARSVLVALFILGVLAIGAGLASGQSTRVWANILSNYYYYMCIAVGGVFFLAIQYITNSMWSVPLRRTAEGLTTFLPFAAVIGLMILVLGGHTLYEWMHIEAMQHDELLASKSAYLNNKFAIFRSIFAFAVWIFIGNKLVKNSLVQDVSGDPEFTWKNIKLSAAFIPLFGLTFSFLAYDFLMSLEPHWFSTMFGVYCFAGLFYSTLCSITILTVLMKRKGLLPGLNENHLHDMGKFMFGFAIFWAYIGFSQFMLIWYANLPEETVYYLRRSEGGWLAMMWLVLITKFVIPFFLLMPRGVKRREGYLLNMAIFMLVAHWLDYYLLVMPNFAPKGPVFGWIELGVAAAFFGLFALVITRFLARVPAMPFRDPRLGESLNHHQ